MKKQKSPFYEVDSIIARRERQLGSISIAFAFIFALCFDYYFMFLRFDLQYILTKWGTLFTVQTVVLGTKLCYGVIRI